MPCGLVCELNELICIYTDRKKGRVRVKVIENERKSEEMEDP